MEPPFRQASRHCPLLPATRSLPCWNSAGDASVASASQPVSKFVSTVERALNQKPPSFSLQPTSHAAPLVAMTALSRAAFDDNEFTAYLARPPSGAGVTTHTSEKVDDATGKRR